MTSCSNTASPAGDLWEPGKTHKCLEKASERGGRSLQGPPPWVHPKTVHHSQLLPLHSPRPSAAQRAAPDIHRGSGPGSQDRQVGQRLQRGSERAKSLSRVRLFATPWTVAHQAPLSVGFSRQEDWSGLPFPPPGGFSHPRDQAQPSRTAGRRFTL